MPLITTRDGAPSLPRLAECSATPHAARQSSSGSFFHNDDHSDYREYLREALVMNGCKLYAFVL